MNKNCELRKGYMYYVKKVRKNKTRTGFVYNFLVSKNMPNGEFANYNCAWFCNEENDQNLQTNDKVKIVDILAIAPNFYGGRLYYNYIVECYIVEHSDVQKVAEPTFTSDFSEFESILPDEIDNDFETFEGI